MTGGAPEQTCASVSILSQIQASILAASRVPRARGEDGHVALSGGGQSMGLPSEANAA